MYSSWFGRLAKQHPLLAIALFASTTGSAPAAIWSGPTIDFDFARTAECRCISPTEKASLNPGERLVEVTLPISVRYHGVAAGDVDELVIEISGAAASLRVASYSPATQLTTDITQAIETTTSSRLANSLDATLGGTLPTPSAELLAHVTPSITASTSRGESASEKITRLPPRQAIVVSGTAFEGRGVFFKLRRSTQTSLEGVHPLTVTFIAPADWQAGTIRVGCSARGQRKLLFVKQPSTLGTELGDVKLHLVREKTAPAAATQVAADASEPTD